MFIYIWVFYLTLFSLSRGVPEGIMIAFVVFNWLLLWGATSYFGSYLYKTVIKRKEIADLDKKDFRVFFLFVFSAMPLSVISVLCYSVTNVNLNDDLMLPTEAVKMGYPIFWLCLAIGLFSLLHNYTKNERNIRLGASIPK